MAYFTRISEDYRKKFPKKEIIEEEYQYTSAEVRLQECISEIDILIQDLLNNTKFFPQGDIDYSFLYNIEQKAQATTVLKIADNVREYTKLNLENVVIASEVLKKTLQRCKKFYRGSFLEEDGAWIDAHLERDETGLWFRDPFLLDWGISFCHPADPNNLFFHYLVDGYNKHYEGWCLDMDVPCTYMIEPIEHRFPNHTGKAGLLDSIQDDASARFSGGLTDLYSDQYDTAFNNFETQHSDFTNSMGMVDSIIQEYESGMTLGTEYTSECLRAKEFISKLSRMDGAAEGYSVNLMKNILKRQVNPDNFVEDHNKVSIIDPDYIVIGCDNVVKILDKFLEGDFNETLISLDTDLANFKKLEDSIESVNKNLSRVNMLHAKEIESRKFAIDYLHKNFTRNRNYYEIIGLGNLKDIDLENDEKVDKLREYLTRNIVASYLFEKSEELPWRKTLAALIYALGKRDNPLVCFNILPTRKTQLFNQNDYLRDLVLKLIDGDIIIHKQDPDSFCLKEYNKEVLYLEFKTDKVLLYINQDILLSNNIDFNSTVIKALNNQRKLLEILTQINN